MVALGIFGTLVDYFSKGGPVMWPLLACSIIGLIFLVERAIYFHRIPWIPA